MNDETDSLYYIGILHPPYVKRKITYKDINFNKVV